MTLLFALATLVVTAQCAGIVARRVGQPAVVGEIVAGIALGPTVLHAWIGDSLIPHSARPALNMLATVGIVLFMCEIGYRSERSLLRGRLRAATGLALGSIVPPFAAGAGLATVLYASHRPASGGELSFALFLGAAMGITAFPVLARILRERALEGTHVGSLALATGAIGDVLAWVLIAAVFAAAGVSAGPAWRLIVILPVAFVIGLALPRRVITFGRPLETVNQTVLLPVYFVLSGARVDLRHIGPAGLRDLALILAVAVSSKFVGVLAAARLGRVPRGEAWVLAVLLNGRGVAGLIVLTLGARNGLIDGTIYSLMLVMAVVTTAMTGPLLTLITRRLPSGSASPVRARRRMTIRSRHPRAGRRPLPDRS